MNEQNPFNWIVDEHRLWPPPNRPKTPFGPTDLEVLRSCPLRRCFEVSPGYERRTGFAARIGIAFHRTLEALTETSSQFQSLSAVAEEAQRKFLQELQKQEEEKAKHPREQRLPKDEIRINRAQESLITEAQRMIWMDKEVFHHKDVKHTQQLDQPLWENKEWAKIDIGEIAETEVPVKSQDNLFRGRIDYVEHLPTGVRLLDYKSALRTDLPERYERQLQFYAFLWHETRGEWPVEAIVVYPFTGTVHQVSVKSADCERIVSESRTLIASLQKEHSVDRLAMPGDVCKVCEFRPWCRPFWQWQASEKSHMIALEKAFLGFEGKIISIEKVNQHWRLTIEWRDSTIQIVAPVDRFPQLHLAHAGMYIRALEMRLRGLRYQPQAIVTEMSEIFLL